MRKGSRWMSKSWDMPWYKRLGEKPDLEDEDRERASLLLLDGNNVWWAFEGMPDLRIFRAEEVRDGENKIALQRTYLPDYEEEIANVKRIEFVDIGGGNVEEK